MENKLSLTETAKVGYIFGLHVAQAKAIPADVATLYLRQHSAVIRRTERTGKEPLRLVVSVAAFGVGKEVGRLTLPVIVYASNIAKRQK